MQNSGYSGGYGSAGYYSSPPAAGGASTAPIPSYGSTTAPPYGSSYPPAPASNDQYSSYSSGQPYGQQPNYYSQAQPNAPAAPPANPSQPTTGYSGGESYGNNSYYPNQPGGAPAPVGSQPPPSYGGYGSGPPPNSQPGWQSGPPPQSNYNSPSGPPGNGYGMNSYGGGMRGGMGGPPPPGGNFRGRPGPPNAGPGFKGGRNGGGYGGPEPDQDTIFISGLPLDATEDQLASYFGAIGVIKIDKKLNKPRIWIYRDKITGEGKGDATLTYDDPHSAKSAIGWFNGKELPGTGKILNIEFAQRKSPPGGMDRGRGGGRGGGPPRNGSGGPDHRGGGRGGGPGGREGFGRQGDWRCPVDTCGNNNFSWRNECNRCKAPRPDDCGGDGGGHHDGPPDRRGPGGPPPFGDRRRGGPGGPPRGHGDRPPYGGPPRGGPGGGRFGGPPRGGPRGPGPMRGHSGGPGDRRSRPY